MVAAYIGELIESGAADTRCLAVLGKHQKQLNVFYASKNNAFTTHSRLFTLDHGFLKDYDAVIFDEDPAMNYILPNQIEIPISRLKEVLTEIPLGSGLAEKITAAIAAAENKSWFGLPCIKYLWEYDDISTPIDISSFCGAERFYRKKKSDENNLWESSLAEDSIVFFKPYRLHRNVKYIILSATANKKVLKWCFGLTHQIIFCECKKAEYKGISNQYCELPLSRAYINRTPGVLENLIKFSGFSDVITFMKYAKGKHAIAPDIAKLKYYFGKTTGVDSLKGKDLTVLGTPHQPPWLYKLFAYTLGLEEFYDENATMSYQWARHNGFSFKFMTFNDANRVLRDIQFWMIESELEQARGRARLTREDCVVNVFSNFPLPQTTLQKIPRHILDKYAKESDSDSV